MSDPAGLDSDHVQEPRKKKKKFQWKEPYLLDNMGTNRKGLKNSVLKKKYIYKKKKLKNIVKVINRGRIKPITRSSD